jgi:transcriptional regulator with XRE-family HTH domain
MATPYAEVLAKNVRAARARKGFEQEPVAARMRALGFSAWRRQTVAGVEKNGRRLAADEVLGLAIALETSLTSLLEPARDDGPITLPSGAELPFLTVHELVWGGNELTVMWDDGVPAFPIQDPPMTVTGYLVPPPKGGR